MTPHARDEGSLAAAARAAAAAARLVEPAGDDPIALEAEARRGLAALGGADLLRHAVLHEGFSVRDVCVVREALAFESGLADVMFTMQGLGSCPVALAGSEPLKARLLPRVASGELIAAFALTEPQAGSDVGAIATRAVRDGADYVVDGVKTYISNAGIAGLYTLFARTSGTGREGITAFALEAPAPGLTLTERISVSAPHPIGTLALSGCRIPATHRLGHEGEGHALALRTLDHFRPTVGAAATGFAARALAESVDRARGRSQFGRALSEFQAIRFKLADMAVWLDASRLLVRRAASLLDEKADAALVRRAGSMAKLYATEAADRIVDEAVQIHGALGVTRGHVVERLAREVRALRIYEGTSEIQRSIIARSLLSDRSP